MDGLRSHSLSLLIVTFLFCILITTILFSFVWFGKRGWQSNKKSLKQ